MAKEGWETPERVLADVFGYAEFSPGQAELMEVVDFLRNRRRRA